jgi:predicted nucleotidyltransferase
MKREKALQILAANQKEFRRFGAKWLAISGSVARDEAHLESDLDVLVEFDGPATFDRYMELKFLLEKLLGCPVDLVTHKALTPRLRLQVEREAI